MFRRLRRKWWFWLGAAGLALVACGLGGVYVDREVTRSRGEARRDRLVAQLDAEDPGWRMHDLAAAHNAALPPPEENAGERVRQADALIPRTFRELWGSPMWPSATPDAVLPDPEDICPALAVHADCGAALAVARSIRHRPRGGFRFEFKDLDPVGSLIPHSNELNQVAALLYLDAVALAYQGRVDEAIQSCHAILNCGRAVGDEPYSISQLNRMGKARFAADTAAKVLGWGEPANGLAELQAAFAEELGAPRLTYALSGDRAMFFHYLQRMDEGRIALGDDDILPADDSPPRRLEFWRFRKDLPRQQAIILEKYNDLLAAAKLDGPARREALKRFDLPEDPEAVRKDILAALMLMGSGRIIPAEDNTRATLAAAVAALACERYRRQFGRWPDSLESIPKDLLPAVPNDPITGKPLTYRRLADGVTVYSVGPDGQDDGGRFEEVAEPSGRKTRDFGVRLWDPDKRRQPAPPPGKAPADREP